jgi:hypothetical protein
MARWSFETSVRSCFRGARADEIGLTAVYKLPVPALSIFPDATPRYCMLKL